MKLTLEKTVLFKKYNLEKMIYTHNDVAPENR